MLPILITSIVGFVCCITLIAVSNDRNIKIAAKVVMIILAIVIVSVPSYHADIKDKNSAVAPVKSDMPIIIKHITTSYHFPEEMSEVHVDQRLICYKILNTDSTRDLYFGFDTYSYSVEFSSVDGYATMSDNGRLVYNFDSTSDVYKVMLKDNE